MPVVEAASRAGYGVVAVLGSAERAALLAIPGDAVALEVGDVGRHGRQAEGPPLMTDTRALTTTRRSAANSRLRLNAVRPRPNAERPPKRPPLLPVIKLG